MINPFAWIFAFAALYASLYVAVLWWSSRPYRCYPIAETWSDRISFSIYKWPEWLQPWGEALVKIMRTVRLMCRVWKTEAEFDEMASRFSAVLSEATGGQMSKLNYQMEDMRAVMQDYIAAEREDELLDHVSDLADWERFDVWGVADHFGLNRGDLIKYMARKRAVRKWTEADATQAGQGTRRTPSSPSERRQAHGGEGQAVRACRQGSGA